jgi:hypothetical protein
MGKAQRASVILKGDIRSCFGEIDHDWLLDHKSAHDPTRVGTPQCAFSEHQRAPESDSCDSPRYVAVIATTPGDGGIERKRNLHLRPAPASGAPAISERLNLP